MKAKTILSAVFTAICMASCILDWDMAMYLSGLVALAIIGLDDLKIYVRFTKLTSQRWLKRFSKSGANRSIRKEVVKA